MANDSFQNEVPASRVNIRYKSTKDGKSEEVELPQRVVVLGDFTQNKGDYEDVEIEEMDKISIDKGSFDKVMESMNLGLDVTVDSKLKPDEELQAKLSFKSMKDFNPDAIVGQVPELAALMKVRGLLNDLKAKVITNKQFKKELEGILLDDEQKNKLMDEIKKATKSDDKPSEE
jgi:type VI secretion system protein ImpB